MEEKMITPGELGIPDAIPLPKRKEWRIGFIGFGWFANAHVKSYARTGWKIEAVADLSEEARERAKQEAGAERVYEDYHDLVRDEGIDVVLLLTQPTLREEAIAAALEAGKPVLTEKPLARTLDECERIVRLTEGSDIPVAVSQNYRWAGANYFAHHIIQKGLIGKPYFAAIEIHGTQDVQLADHPFYSTCEDFLTLQWNVHMIDLLRYWTGGEPQRVFSCSRRMDGQNFVGDGLMLSFIDFGEGLTGHIMHSELLRSSMGSRRCRIDGDGGSMVFDLSGDTLSFESKQMGGGVMTLDMPELLRSQCGSMGDLLISVEEGREPMVSPRRNLATMRQVLGEEEAVKQGGVWFDLGGG